MWILVLLVILSLVSRVESADYDAGQKIRGLVEVEQPDPTLLHTTIGSPLVGNAGTSSIFSSDFLGWKVKNIGYTSAVTGTITLTPSSGKRLYIYYIIITIDTQTSNACAYLAFNPSPDISNAIVICPVTANTCGAIGRHTCIAGAINTSLYCTAPANSHISIWYTEY
jgi:hypothetical protein